MRVVIIGSGLGGLSTGAMLARKGHEVIILEQAHQIGGCLQCFERDGVRFETGMHIVGSLGEGEILSNYLKLFGIDGKVHFSQLDRDAYDIISMGGKRFDFANGHERMIESLMRQFPNQGDNLRCYWKLVDSVAQSAPYYFGDRRDREKEGMVADSSLFKRSLNGVIAQVVDDPLLRQVLVGNIPLYAAVENRTPFSTHAFVADFYNKGAYRVVGGSDNIAKAFREVIENNGGKLLTNKRVCSIVCKNFQHTAGETPAYQRKVEKVTTSDGESYEGDIFVSDIHPVNLLSLFSPDVLRSAYVERVASLANTTPVFSLFLRFKDDSVPYLNSNYFCYRGNATPWTLGHCAFGEWPDGYLYMHHCHADGAEYAKSGVMLSYMPFEWVKEWEESRQGKRDAEYEKFKARCAAKMLDALDESYPGIKSCVKNYYSATPLTYRDYTLTPEGSLYGVLRDIDQGVTGRISWRTKLPNLMLVGQNINAHGILGVLIGSMQVTNASGMRGGDCAWQPRPTSNLNMPVACVEGIVCGSPVPVGTRASSPAIEGSRTNDGGCKMYDKTEIAIIGGGLGGLFTGAILAKNGKRVTIVEKNRSIGGGLHMFRRGDVEFATGMHVFGGFIQGSTMRRICRYLGIENSLCLKDTDADCMDEIITPERRYALPSGKENYVRYLSALFPEEAEGIRRYVDALFRLAYAEISYFLNSTSTESFVLHPSIAGGDARVPTVENEQFLWPADDLIAYYIKDKKLRSLLSYLSPLYSGVKGETPAYEHAIVNAFHIEGSSMFADGSQHMADALARIVKEAGGEVITGEEVVRIEVKNHMAMAIETKGGRRIEAENFVSDIDPQQLVRIVTPGAFPASFCSRVNDAPYTYSAFKLFLKLKKGKMPLVSHPLYFYNDVKGEGVWDADKVKLEEWPLCAMAVMSGGSDGTAETMTVVSPITYDWFEQWGESRVGHRAKEYYTFKKELEQKVFSLLKRSVAGLEENVEEMFSSTPLTIRDYNGIHRGSMYGFHKDCNHIMYTKLSVHTKVRNLFLTGQSVNLHGMSGVTITSVMTAEAILGEGEVRCRMYDVTNASGMRGGDCA